jgi:alpha-galactosidase
MLAINHYYYWFVFTVEYVVDFSYVFAMRQQEFASMKIVFIGAGSGFGAISFCDIMSFPELRDSEVVLIDINPDHLNPVAAYCRKVAEHYGAPAKITTALDWRGGALDGADFVMTSFAQGGAAYAGVPFYYDIEIPKEYGIYQNIADTAGIGGVFRTMRTAPELLAIGHDMEERCPGATLLNYVNPMAMLTRSLTLACPKINVIGLCHNIQYGIRDIARWIGVSHKDLVYSAAGINHLTWFLRLEHSDGRSAYPDLLKAAEREEVYKERTIQFELLKTFGYFTTESHHHLSEYQPYFAPRKEDRESVGIEERHVTKDVVHVASRWNAESDMMRQLNGDIPLRLERTHEYGMHIMHAKATDNVYRMNVNVLNNGLIDNLPDGYCVEVPCTADRVGLHPNKVGNLPIHLAALCRGVADMQTLASDAVLERDLNKAYLACAIDPLTAACATPARIKECFNKLVEAESDWLKGYWPRA